jgi:Protein of unknown function (DUF3108)
MRISIHKPSWLCCAALSLCFLQTKTSPPAQSNQRPLPTISAAPAGKIVPPPANYRYPNDQTYVYGVEWHLLNAGTGRVVMKPEGAQQHVIATAESAGVVNSLYKVHDRFEAFFDARTFCSLRITKHTEEGSHLRQTDVHFDYARHKSVLDEKNLKTGETKHVENDVPDCVTDVISGFYYLASLPLQVGNTYDFAINDGGKTTEISAHVESREQIKAPAGTFQTVRVKAEPVSGSLKGKGTVWAWFSDDANHTPVQMRSKLGWGTLLFRLQRIDKE